MDKASSLDVLVILVDFKRRLLSYGAERNTFELPSCQTDWGSPFPQSRFCRKAYRLKCSYRLIKLSRDGRLEQ